MMTAARHGLAVFAAVLLASACAGSSTGSSESSPSPSPSPSPVKYAIADTCQLVTVAEAQAAVSDTQLMNLTSAGGVAIPGFCFYGDPSGKNVGVFVYAQAYPDTTTADQVQPDQVAAVLGGRLGVTNAHSVTGIGDKAFEYTASGSGGSGIAIFVFKANVVIMIAIDPTSDSSKVEDLARSAVSRLTPA